MIAQFIATATTYGLSAGIAGGIGFQLVVVTRLAVYLVRDRVCNYE